MTPRFFKDGPDLRRWLEKNHDQERELWVGFYTRSADKKGITHREALDEALCFGWIDGVKKTVGEGRYTMRFSPRRPGSNWSLVNIARARELAELGRMRPPGRAAFEARDEARSRRDADQRAKASLDPAGERTFRANRAAWDFFQSRPPGYRHLCTRWVMEAKQEETRQRRLATLIAASAKGVAIPGLAGRSGRKPRR